MPDWWLTKDGDKSCLELYRRHYDGRAVIEAEDFHKILEAMGVMPDDLAEVLKTIG